MAILTMVDLDEEGNKIRTDYEIPQDVFDYIEQCDEDHAILFGQLLAAYSEIEQLKTVIEGYEILCGGREVDN